MKKILIFIIVVAMSLTTHVGAAVRDGTNTQRATQQKRISTTTSSERTTTARSSILVPQRTLTERSATGRGQSNVVTRPLAAQTPSQSGISARAATQTQQISTSETRTGAAYETCKSAFFTCMDQFCALKNDDYQRCSCSNRISKLEKQRTALTDAGQELTVFTENLDVVGLTAAQATAMKTASEGENALASDTSASKALLQAIMNSISGGDTTVGGKYSGLNTINMSYDLTTAFGDNDSQIIASYNGLELYTAVYPRCRKAVAADCNNASLQRAVNAYLMAIEQDCNTVQTAIEERQSQMKSAIREGSAMLDLARVENRRKHNSDDLATCINNIESAILSEEVCGANYHKCLDNGEFIDKSTGAPIAGVVNFDNLGKLLTFDENTDIANQQLSKRASNRLFVSNFEKRTKMFAAPALDKCTEIADEAWSEYLDKAMLAIYYAQQSKISEITQGCLDFVSNCYEDKDGSITSAMAALIGSGLTILQPDKIALTTEMCKDYVASCDGMFEGGIIAQYVNTRQKTDTLTACRAVVKQCFDKYGGTGYENFYYPYSGLFKTGSAGDWFTLYDLTNNETLKSPCAKQLKNLTPCQDDKIIEQAFGGFDRMYTSKDPGELDQLLFDISGNEVRYGTVANNTDTMRNRVLRPTGVATEIYNQIIDTLTTQCANIGGRFVERQFIKENIYGGKNQSNKNICLWYPQEQQQLYADYKSLAKAYGIFASDGDSVPEDFIGEDMCPRDYNLNVDTSFWGACLCWENGARRSKNGKSATCVAELPTKPMDDKSAKDALCWDATAETWWELGASTAEDTSSYSWCTQYTNTDGQVCPYGYTPKSEETEDSYVCRDDNNQEFDQQNLIPEVIIR